VHCNLLNITPVATKVHMVLRRYVVFTYMRDNREFNVACDFVEEYKVDIAMMTS
jgi:hypothetical protein